MTANDTDGGNEMNTNSPYDTPTGTTSSNHRWAVKLDGSLEETHASRREAREHAAWLRRHPAVRDRKRHGNGGRIVVEDRCDRGWWSDR
jgi:hypothetical protein